MKLASWLAGMAILLGIGGLLLARPGIVKTNDGRSFEGEVTDRGADGAVVVTRAGALTIGRKDIASIDYTDNIPEQYKQKLAALPKNAGARDHVDLAQWLFENKAYDLALKESDTALRLDPDSREAKLLKQMCEKQIIWSQTKTVAPDATAPTPANPLTPTAPAPNIRPVNPALHPLLNADQVNYIRQGELRETDRVRVKFEKDVKKRFIEASGAPAVEFNAIPDMAKALAILKRGEPELSADVKILDDPLPIAVYRKTVQPMLLTGCATAACHGGGNSGTFFLHNSGSPDAMTYTNYYILTHYSTEVDGVAYKAVDRIYPQKSLIYQFGMPREQAKTPHPAAPGFAPLFRNDEDQRIGEMQAWLERAILAVEPSYQVDLPVHHVAPPTTQPADQSTAEKNGNAAPPPPPGDEKKGNDVNDALKEARERLRPRGL